jgi:molybdate transport system substrate-binding protein
VFATNRLAIAVAAGNPLGLHDLADLARDDIVVVLADPAVPAGQFAQQALDRAAVTLAPASLEQDVRGVVSRIELGEADAGIVYVTDIISPAIRAVTIPPQHNVSASYPIALLAGSPNPDAAEMFVDYVLSADGQEILADFGFGPA